MNPFVAHELGIMSDSDYRTICCLIGIVGAAIACIVVPIYIHDFWQWIKRK